MELRLQEFISSVEKLSDLRNLDVFNPIVFQLEHPLTAIRYTVVGGKVEPSYLGIPVNTTWVVLDSQSPYYRMALKLVDVNDSDRATTIPNVVSDDGLLTLYWNVIRTYDEIFSVPQYYNNGGKGPKGDRGDTGLPGTVDYNLAIATLAGLTGTLSIAGANTVDENTSHQYSLTLVESEILADGTIMPPAPRQVQTPVFLIGNVPAGTYMDVDNTLHIGEVTQNVVVRLHATHPSWAKAASADLDVLIQNVASSVTGMQLTGPDNVTSGNTAQYSVAVSWSDGTVTSPDANWTLDATSFGTISASGLLTVPTTITGSGSVNVAAHMTLNGTLYTPNKTVIVTKAATAPTVTGVSVSGLTAVNSGTSAQYATNVLWSNGTTTHPAAVWSLDSNAFGSVSASGLLTVPSGIAASGQVAVTASFAIDGVQYAPAASVNVTKVVAATVASVVITGNANVNSGTNSPYALLVTWSNNTTTTPAATSWALSSVDFGSIDAAGLLSVPSSIAASGQVVVSASATVDGTAYAPSKTVDVTKVAVSAVAPYYGVGPALPTDWNAFIPGLSQYAALTVDGKYQDSIDCIGSTTYMYFAYPSSHGEATFFDKQSQFFGGWGGAGNASAGPSAASNAAYKDMPIQQNIILNGVSTPCYIYRTDYSNLGPASGNQWEVTLTTP